MCDGALMLLAKLASLIFMVILLSLPSGLDWRVGGPGLQLAKLTFLAVLFSMVVLLFVSGLPDLQGTLVSPTSCLSQPFSPLVAAPTTLRLQVVSCRKFEI